MADPEKNHNEAQRSHAGAPGVASGSRKLAVSVSLLLLLAMCVFWLINDYTTRNLLRQQADGLGRAVAGQTANQLRELLLANDLISINLILGELVGGAAIAEVSVFNADFQAIASASARTDARALIPLPLTLVDVDPEYTAPIMLAGSVAGYVRLTLDLANLEAGMVNNLLFVVAAALLLIIVAGLVISVYYQSLVGFPARLLAFFIANVRKGAIESCPEPGANTELGVVIRQFNATADFLARYTFLARPQAPGQDAAVPELESDRDRQPVSLLAIQLVNFQYLASTLREEVLIGLLNKYYFYAGMVSRLYSGTVNHCAEGEVLADFSALARPDEQAFHAVCAGQLFLQLVDDLKETGGGKFRLAVHSGSALVGLYSPISDSTGHLSGRSVDETRELCAACPDDSLLISATAWRDAGADARLDAGEFGKVGGEDAMQVWLNRAPLPDYRLLLEQQARRLRALYPH